MNFDKILEMVGKGVKVIETLYQAEQDIAPALKVVVDLVTGAKSGTVTEAELTATERTLDRMIDDFNQPMTD